MDYQTFTVELAKVVVELAKVVVWPAVVGTALWHFRERLGRAIDAAVSFFSVLEEAKVAGIELKAKRVVLETMLEVKAADLQADKASLDQPDLPSERKNLLDQTLELKQAELERLRQIVDGYVSTRDSGPFLRTDILMSRLAGFVGHDLIRRNQSPDLQHVIAERAQQFIRAVVERRSHSIGFGAAAVPALQESGRLDESLAPTPLGISELIRIATLAD